MKRHLLLAIILLALQSGIAQAADLTPDPNDAWINPFNNKVCGPDACGYVLHPTYLGPFQPMPNGIVSSTYQSETYAQPHYSSTPYAYYQNGNIQYLPRFQPVLPTHQTTYTPQYNPILPNESGASSNASLDNMLRQMQPPAQYKPQYTPVLPEAKTSYNNNLNSIIQQMNTTQTYKPQYKPSLPAPLSSREQYMQGR